MVVVEFTHGRALKLESWANAWFALLQSYGIPTCKHSKEVARGISQKENVEFVECGTGISSVHPFFCNRTVKNFQA